MKRRRTIVFIAITLALIRGAHAGEDDPFLPVAESGASLGAPVGDWNGGNLDRRVIPANFDEASEEGERQLGSALFGGDPGAPVFGPSAPASGKDPPKWPNIEEPGPDMGDFPNSSYTLPKGRAYVEFSPVTMFTADREIPAGYVAPFLLRYGVTDNVEFRIFGNGVTSLGDPHPTTGFSPLNLDVKAHLWNDRREWFIPAAALEVFLLTTWGSSQFDGGWQPALNMNFDLPIAKRLNLEWTLGYHGVQEAININTKEVFVPRFNFLIPGIHHTFTRNFNQFAAQWALEYEVSDQLQLFVHGFHNGAILFNLGSGEMVGAGAFWKFNSRVIMFGSANSGLTPDLPSFAAQLGFAVAL